MNEKSMIRKQVRHIRIDNDACYDCGVYIGKRKEKTGSIRCQYCFDKQKKRQSR